VKILYIIAGCNGAGKTTASLTILPEIWKCKEFVNADEIARGLSPFNPEGVAIEAGRFFWLDTPEAAIFRVAKRVSEGGHNIPKDVIVRRYQAGINNLIKLFIPIVDYWAIYNNTTNPRTKIATSFGVADTEQFNKLNAYVKG